MLIIFSVDVNIAFNFIYWNAKKQVKPPCKQPVQIPVRPRSGIALSPTLPAQPFPINPQQPHLLAAAHCGALLRTGSSRGCVKSHVGYRASACVAGWVPVFCCFRASFRPIALVGYA